MPANAQRSRLSVQDLLDEPELGLTLVAGSRGVERQVGGVHISEMPDPTPWLAPGMCC
ncbi:MAG: PucR family transcriptional regulator ligand-binding domain-containing protein [Thermoleophilia bacterium]|nr:PucR family transcriptional regulator ligand-binding domain-containing protein [Thermoleophilia bacterium]